MIEPHPLTGIEVYEDLNMVTWRQRRFPRSKRKRIREKWRKDRGNWTADPKLEVYVFPTLSLSPYAYRRGGPIYENGQRIVGHPEIIRRFIERANETARQVEANTEVARDVDERIAELMAPIERAFARARAKSRPHRGFPSILNTDI